MLQGFEIINMIRKGQVQGVEKGDVKGQVALIATLFGVAAYTQQAEPLPPHFVLFQFLATQPYISVEGIVILTNFSFLTSVYSLEAALVVSTPLALDLNRFG